MRYKATVLLIGSLVAGSCTGAFARPAITTFNANLRSAPGVGSPAIAIVPDQAMISVHSCRRSWCLVDWNGVEGYLSSTLIAYAPRYAAAAAAEPTATFDQGPQFAAQPPGISYGFYDQDDNLVGDAAAYDYSGYDGYGYNGVGVGFYGGYGGNGYSGFRDRHGYWPSDHSYVGRSHFGARGNTVAPSMGGAIPRRSGFAANHINGARPGVVRSDARGR